MATKTFSAILCFIVSVPFTGLSQNHIRGMVADSASMQPLPNVNVRVKSSHSITTTDIRGMFSIVAYDHDTLIFSRVGYFAKHKQAKYVKEVVVIFLTEENRTLKSITINADNPVPWLPKIPPLSPYRNLTNDQRTINTPGFQGFQTFGPGVVVGAPISRFSKHFKEKKKSETMREENYKARNYVSIVNDSAVKNKIMLDYDLTEKQYFELLASFNEKNKDIIYELEANELISILILFYSENTKKK